MFEKYFLCFNFLVKKRFTRMTFDLETLLFKSHKIKVGWIERRYSIQFIFFLFNIAENFWMKWKLATNPLEIF